MSINKLNINLIYNNSIRKNSNDNDLIYVNSNDNNLVPYKNDNKSINKESNDNNSIYNNLIYNNSINNELNPSNSFTNIISNKLSFKKLNHNSSKEFNYNNELTKGLNNDNELKEILNKNKLIKESDNELTKGSNNDNKLTKESDNKLTENLNNDNKFTKELDNDNKLIEILNDKLLKESINKLLNKIENNKFIDKSDDIRLKRELSEKLNIEIKLELLNPNKIYELFDTIDGILKLKLNKNLDSKLIRIKLKCVGEVKWQLPNCDLNSNLDNCLKERENFLNTDYNVEKNYKPVCEVGQHNIPFNFKLIDKKLPPTFKENNGFICYYITASILNDKTGKLLIKTAPIYLNKVQIGCIRNDLKLSIGANASKVFSNYCFRKKNKVQVYIYISRKAYTQGEIIPIELHIINNSNHKINSNIILYQTKCFYCKNRQHIVEHHFEQLECTQVLKGKDVKEIINLKIPDNCVLSFNSSIIIVNYFIICNVNITKSIDLHLNLPIIITTHKSLNSS